MRLLLVIGALMVLPVFGHFRGKNMGTLVHSSFEMLEKHHIAKRKATPFILGGKKWTYDEIPQHFIPIMIQIDKEHFCGGTLLDGKHILTAAHCFFRSNTICNRLFRYLAQNLNLHIKLIVSQSRWRQGTYDPNQMVIHADGNCIGCKASSDGKMRPAKAHKNIVDSVIIPKSYVSSKCRRSDIAVVRLTEPVATGFDMRISYQEKPAAGTILSAGGFGYNPNVTTANVFVSQPSFPADEKDESARFLNVINATVAECARGNRKDVICIEEKESNACRGDSGGGILDDSGKSGHMTVYGVVAHGTSCKLMHSVLMEKRGFNPLPTFNFYMLISAGLRTDANFKGGYFTSTDFYAPFICKATFQGAKLDGPNKCSDLDQNQEVLSF
uniref:Peptidase S1 domain-containing protein n=1 Tax=Steinernema glaseri TaxID=37863 RepID=A0A1I7ZQJ2_9BILA